MYAPFNASPLLPPPSPSPVIDGGEWNKSLVNFGFVNSVSIVIPLVEVNQSIISLVVLYKLDTHCIAFGNYNIQPYMACLQTSDLPIFRNSDLPIFRTSDLPILRTSDLPIFRGVDYTLDHQSIYQTLRKYHWGHLKNYFRPHVSWFSVFLSFG